MSYKVRLDTWSFKLLKSILTKNARPGDVVDVKKGEMSTPNPLRLQATLGFGNSPRSKVQLACDSPTWPADGQLNDYGLIG